MVEGCETTAVLVVREFDPEKDCKGVEEAERRCEVGSGGKLSLYTDLLGDPICRVRHSPAYLMLVCIHTYIHLILVFYSSNFVFKICVGDVY